MSCSNGLLSLTASRRYQPDTVRVPLRLQRSSPSRSCAAKRHPFTRRLAIPINTCGHIPLVPIEVDTSALDENSTLNQNLEAIAEHLVYSFARSLTGTGDWWALNAPATSGWWYISEPAAALAGLNVSHCLLATNGFAARQPSPGAVVPQFAAHPLAALREAAQYLDSFQPLAGADPSFLARHLGCLDDRFIVAIQQTWNAQYVAIYGTAWSTVDLRNQARLYFVDPPTNSSISQSQGPFDPNTDLRISKSSLLEHCLRLEPAACQAFAEVFGAAELKALCPEGFAIYNWLVNKAPPPGQSLPHSNTLVLFDPCEAICLHNLLMVEWGLPYLQPYAIESSLLQEYGATKVAPSMVPMFPGPLRLDASLRLPSASSMVTSFWPPTADPSSAEFLFWLGPTPMPTFYQSSSSTAAIAAAPQLLMCDVKPEVSHVPIKAEPEAELERQPCLSLPVANVDGQPSSSAGVVVISPFAAEQASPSFAGWACDGADDMMVTEQYSTDAAGNLCVGLLVSHRVLNVL